MSAIPARSCGCSAIPGTRTCTSGWAITRRSSPRQTAQRDPLLAGEVTAGADAAPAGDPGADLIVVAPHIASFLSALPVGSTVAAGEAVARIELLGEEIAVPADRAGTVSQVLAEAGALVEYSAPLVRLLAA
ncbi:acetyl-CoA carboxylase biotin carboxyl carrier protein subunit [Novosphingobium colocasiae]